MSHKIPFKILSIEHIAIAVNDLNDPANLFGQLLGINHSSTEEIKEQKVLTDIYDTGNGKVELLQSVSDVSPIAKFLNKRGEGIHHIAFKVDDIHSALAYLKSNGVRLIDETPRKGAEGLFIAFLHPKSTNGVLIELCME
ncbi:MAG: methylmalonyl-CoA epimerase [Candidatus Marinimicrobia bacterium]|nr:methylmalonyl-CoA epimerase [Candidatus Neomarinimicrobiota bacterium]MBL7022672.1 methylmalonyl-CoA epimerase [Candidatus Neomarinimicrobiota bacterium]MBL7109934.1 methylmalonyl-CoA epimerase [Candidatus Neomarinimicrobiota bacterium]